MITTYYPPCNFGGDGLFVRALSRALRARGHEVHVVHCFDAYALKSGVKDSSFQESDDGVVVHRLKSRFGPLSPLLSHQTGRPGIKFGELQEILSLPFDVVNFHNVSLMGGPTVVSMSQAPVTLYTFHDHWLLCPTHSFWKDQRKPCDEKSCLRCVLKSGLPPQLWRYFGRSLEHLDRVDRFLSPSRFTAQAHQEGFPKWPIEVVPTFSNLFGNGVLSVANSRREGFLFAGRLVASKGIEMLLEEFQHNGLALDVAGVGPMEHELRSRFGALTNIKFLGELTQDRLNRLYHKKLAVIVPSLAPEVFPLVCLEAMESGTPVICSRAGGCSEAVEGARAGVAFETPEELRRKIRWIDSNRERAEEMGRRGRIHHSRHYTESAYLSRYFDLVESILVSKGLPCLQGETRKVAGYHG